MLGKGSQPIEITGIIKEFVACPAEPRLSGQVSQDLSRVPLLLRLCGRRQIFDHVDFPQSADQARRTRMRNFSAGYASDWVEDRRSRRAAHLGAVSGWAAVGPRKASLDISNSRRGGIRSLFRLTGRRMQPHVVSRLARSGWSTGVRAELSLNGGKAARRGQPADRDYRHN